MPKRSTVLKELLRERHWQTYATFCRQYDKAARGTDPVLAGRWPSRGQFARWLSGDLKGMPQPDHCRVLEAMFDSYTVQELFAASASTSTSARRSQRVEPRLDPAPISTIDLTRGPSAPVPLVPGARRPATSLLPHGDPAPGPITAPTGTPARAPLPPSPSWPSSGPLRPNPLSTGLPSATPPSATPPSAAPPSASQLSASPSSASPLSASLPSASPPGSIRPGSTRPSAELDLQALSEEMTMTTEQSARFVRGAQGGVDHIVLDQLAADVRQLAIDYLTRPPLVIFRPLSRLRAEVFALLDQRQRPAVLPPLYAVAGRLCALLAHASADLGHSYAAETHTRTAWLCADLADDDSLRAYVRWVQSNVAYWDGNHRQAAQIAHDGQRYATKGSNLLRLASQEARAWAACGQATEVEQALSVASAAREQRVVDDQAGVFRFDPGKAAYYASEVRLALGGQSNARLAAGNAIEALQLFEDGPEAHRSPEFVAAARLDLANAQLALHDLEGASGQLRTVLQLPVECRTQPIVGRVSAAAATLNTKKFTHSALANDLKEEIALFRAYSAQRDLPEGND